MTQQDFDNPLGLSPRVVDALHQALEHSPRPYGHDVDTLLTTPVDQDCPRRSVKPNCTEFQRSDVTLCEPGLSIIPSVCDFITADVGRVAASCFGSYCAKV